jgi:MOSC domain-containing protein
VLAIGAMRMRLDQHDERCVVVNVDPDTTERDPSILRAIAQERNSRFGVYGSVVEPGRIAVGDLVTVA